MYDAIWTRIARAGWIAALGLASLALWTASPAAAQSACQSGDGEVLVEFLGTGTSNTVLMEQIDGTTYQGDLRIRVYCGIDGQLVPDATVELSTTVPSDAVLDPATNTWLPIDGAVKISVPSGERVLSIRSTEPNLLGTNWKVKVGTNTVTVVGAFGKTLSGNEYPTATGMVWAQTPELGSLALFAAGAAGIGGYGLTRLRARTGQRGRRG